MISAGKTHVLIRMEELISDETEESPVDLCEKEWDKNENLKKPHAQYEKPYNLEARVVNPAYVQWK